MPAKPSLTASISLHPRDGITPETVGKLKDWVGKQDNVVYALAVTEPNADGKGRHLHLAIGFEKHIKVSDDYKDRLRTILREELSQPEVWGKHAIKCVAHPDPAQLIGGYYKKSDYILEFQIGTPPSAEEQEEGAKRYEQNLQRVKKQRISKYDIPDLFRETHLKLIEDEELDYQNYGNPRHYVNLTPAEQVEQCYGVLIQRAYRKIIMELSEAKLRHFAKIWKYLIAPECI